MLIEIAKLPLNTMGFGHVKIEMIKNNYKKRKELYNQVKNLEQFNLNAAE